MKFKEFCIEIVWDDIKKYYEENIISKPHPGYHRSNTEHEVVALWYKEYYNLHSSSTNQNNRYNVFFYFESIEDLVAFKMAVL